MLLLLWQPVHGTSKVAIPPCPTLSPPLPLVLAVPARPLPRTDPDSHSLAAKREEFLRECIPVLQQAGGSLPVKKLQPDYQTLYKRSPCASDYGVETLKELFKTSPLFKVCAPVQRGNSVRSDPCRLWTTGIMSMWYGVRTRQGSVWSVHLLSALRCLLMRG